MEFDALQARVWQWEGCHDDSPTATPLMLILYFTQLRK